MTVLQNIEEYATARREVEAHCMCARIEEAAGKLVIWYPAGDFPTAGLRIDRNAVMLRKAVGIMERVWIESFPGAVAR